jgi:PAS domain S-box-containing protein
MMPALERSRARKAAHEAAAPAAGEDHAAGLMLDERGMVCAWDRACEMLFGHRPSEIVSLHVSKLLPQLADVELLKDGQPNSRLRYLCRIGVRFHALSRSGEQFPCDLFLNSRANPGLPALHLIVRRAERE